MACAIEKQSHTKFIGSFLLKTTQLLVLTAGAKSRALHAFYRSYIAVKMAMTRLLAKQFTPEFARNNLKSKGSVNVAVFSVIIARSSWAMH